MVNRILAGLAVGMLLLVIGCSSPGPILQTGVKANDDIVVTLDNPDFTQPSVELKPAQTKWNGTMAREIDATSGGVSVANGDFVVRTSKGDGPAQSNGTSLFRSVADEDLPPRPDADGHFASDLPPAHVDLQASGLRIGYTPLLVQLFQVEPDHSSPTVFQAVRVRLDPDVALVPIEAVVVFHDKDQSGRLNDGMEQQTIPQQLALWDHLSPAQTSNATDAQFGELTSAIHVMTRYRRDSEGIYHVGTQAAPDTVWAACGVQFRLVNYFELQVPVRNVYPSRGNGDADRQWPIGTVDDVPLQENADLVKRDPRHMEGAITAIFMGRAGFSDAPEVGRALSSRQVIGVSLAETRGTDAIIAHELGHLSGLGDAQGNEKDAAGKPKFDVMVQVGPGVHPTEAECLGIKKWARNFKKFFDAPPKNPHQP